VLRRFAIALGRFIEAGDDELALAFHCGSGETRPFDRRRAARAYAARTLPLYGFEHVQRGTGMALKAIGIKPQGVAGKILTRVAWLAFRGYARRLERGLAHA
jgi:hypothetical protein